MSDNKLALAIDALREVAQSNLLGTDGVFLPMHRYDLADAAVMFALDKLGEIETIERTEPYSGKNQVYWQGQRLRDHKKPSAFRISITSGAERLSPQAGS